MHIGIRNIVVNHFHTKEETSRNFNTFQDLNQPRTLPRRVQGQSKVILPCLVWKMRSLISKINHKALERACVFGKSIQKERNVVPKTY